MICINKNSLTVTVTISHEVDFLSVRPDIFVPKYKTAVLFLFWNIYTSHPTVN